MADGFAAPAHEVGLMLLASAVRTGAGFALVMPRRAAIAVVAFDVAPGAFANV